MAKQKFKITNWSTYNKALINRGSLTFWLDDGAIQAWYESATPSSRGRPQRYSDLAITTVLVIKRVFRLTLRAAQGFIDSIFTLMNVPLRCPDYSRIPGYRARIRPRRPDLIKRQVYCNGENGAGRYTAECMSRSCGPEFSGGQTPSCTARVRTSKRCSKEA